MFNNLKQNQMLGIIGKHFVKGRPSFVVPAVISIMRVLKRTVFLALQSCLQNVAIYARSIYMDVAFAEAAGQNGGLTGIRAHAGK
jgi:hypothetical protein